MPCPICGSGAQISPLQPTPGGGEAHHLACERCGSYFVTEEGVEDLPGMLQGDIERVARVAYQVHRLQRGSTRPIVTADLVNRFLATPLPSVFEQANNLILWIGTNISSPGEYADLNQSTHQFIVGAKTPAGFSFLVTHLLNTGYLEGPQMLAGGAHITLTFQGWQHLDQLQRAQIDSRNAFMAMQYGNNLLDEIVDKHFRPAVLQTGFELIRLDDRPMAGLIDDRLRVEIRNSRFLIADLSHDNLGAYWEAGYAEGLGKPVIYTCDKKKFDDVPPHFDTNHHLIVVWDAKNLPKAADDLKATIRATLPDEARLKDD